MDDRLLINEVSSLLGVEPSAIRYWEKKGLLHLQRDFENDYRYFDSKALLEVLDIVFFRKLQLPIKDLSKHLSGTVEEKQLIIKKVRSDVEELIVKLNQADKTLSLEMERLNEIEELQLHTNKMSEEMDFSEVESLNFLHKSHTQQYLSDPSHFILLINEVEKQTIKEGIILDKKNSEDKHVIWRKNESTDIIFGGLLLVNSDDYEMNTLNELRESLSITPAYNQVIAQYLTTAKDSGHLFDYYKCWFMKVL